MYVLYIMLATTLVLAGLIVWESEHMLKKEKERNMKKLIADKYIINNSLDDAEFYYGEKNGVLCWPLRYHQGCYGDCPDCRIRWVEKLRLLGDLPLDLLKEKEV